MTEAECLTLARLRLDDRNEPYLWSDAVLRDFLRSAMNEAAERARLIEDTEQVATTSGVASYTLQKPVMEVLRVTLSGVTVPLRQVHRDYLDSRRSGWETESGQPTAYMHDPVGTLILVPTPETAAIVTVRMYRSLHEDDELEVLPATYHRDLVWWVAFEAFLLRDADGEDSPRAQHALTMFERRFGPRKTAVYDRAAREMPAGVTAWIGRLA